ncbi:hypothetical protein [Phenylobacterium sp.]|uniref:hypothetical protein n=1 Tax=Phenylobacterium sp. TaxID=1871053 RepID=UPI0008D3D9D5|nr:hypothetical protein [Phenylobacterium sp.]MBA4792986.1 hypothetical protein [Phenylobacterium sp.]MBC7169146.1 hypothetical protein [Phenylobacterium sp.]OHB33650.1 MAG: hypothetical protein A2882_06850 [Phenylobacterium sp. RIFCSPHIGHO2_01_FULL_70_10]
MDLTITLAAGAALLALTVFSGWMGARPPDLKRGPRMVPYRFLMLMGAAGLIVMLVHLVNLLGVTTGRPGY